MALYSVNINIYLDAKDEKEAKNKIISELLKVNKNQVITADSCLVYKFEGFKNVKEMIKACQKKGEK